MPIELICLDADDTLWHNMRHFKAAEDALLAMLQPFADAHVARDALNACEARNLKLYGYGAKGFTLSMIETAVELAGEAVSRDLVAAILKAGQELLAHPVILFEASRRRWKRSPIAVGWCWSPRATCSTRKPSSPPRAWDGISRASRSSATRKRTPSAACSRPMASRPIVP